LKCEFNVVYNFKILFNNSIPRVFFTFYLFFILFRW